MGRTGQRRSAASEPIVAELGIRSLFTAYPPEMVEASIERVGCAEQRERVLPASVVVYFVMALALHPQLGYRQVFRLVQRVVARDGPAGRGAAQVSSPALTKARRRLGVAMFEDLFRAGTPRLPPIGVAVPGSDHLHVVTATRAVLRAVPTRENCAGLGAAVDGSVPVGLHVLRDVPSGAVRAAGIAAAHRSVVEVWSGLSTEPPGPVLVVADELEPVEPSIPRLVRSAGNELLWQSGAGFRFVPEKVLPDGSVLCRGDYRSAAPRDPGAHFRVLDRNGRDPLSSRARVEDRLMTTYLDCRAAPVGLLAALHAATMPTARSCAGGDSTFLPRSKDPAGVEQEIWALLLAQRAARFGG